jgi:hypothetical protein
MICPKRPSVLYGHWFLGDCVRQIGPYCFKWNFLLCIPDSDCLLHALKPNSWHWFPCQAELWNYKTF